MQIAEMREQSHLSQGQFAGLFGIPVRTIQQWEQGRSSPPDYVITMIRELLPRKLARNGKGPRYSIPEKTRWRICIDRPFANCNRVHPLQQRKVRELLDDITANASVESVILFGSSVTQRCHVGSDVDLYVKTEDEGCLVSRPHDFPFDLWTPRTADDGLKHEIEKTGVTVYG